MPWTDADTTEARKYLPELQPAALVHLNNAGCSIPSTATLAAVLGYLQREAAQGGYEVADASAAALQRPYTALAQLINCCPTEIAVVSSATAAWQQVVYGLAWSWKAGDRVLASLAEYGSNCIALLQLAKRTGITLQVIPETVDGDVDVVALEQLIRDGKLPVLVCISHVPTSSGRVYDAAAVGAVCRRAGVLYLLDACQSVGQLPLDVQAIGCDFLSATGRKYLRAPRGSGFLFCRRDALDKLEPGALDNQGARWTGRNKYTLQPTAERFESYEMSFAAKVGLGVAAAECVALGIDSIWERIRHLAGTLRSGLQQLPHVAVLDRGRCLCGLISFSVAGMTADQVQQALAAQHINTSVSRAGSTRFDFEQRGIAEVVRASVHYFNTEGELQQLLRAVAGLAAADQD